MMFAMITPALITGAVVGRMRFKALFFFIAIWSLIVYYPMAHICLLYTSLADYAVIQINDTHPSMVIPELIRLLTERGIEFEEACEIVSHVCAYTNHTILAEALEKWPISYLEEVVPHLMPIIRKLDERIKAKYPQENLAIIDKNDLVHMAHMDIHYGFSINGVASLHTDILKEMCIRDRPWPSGSLLPGFHRNSGTSGRRNRT